MSEGNTTAVLRGMRDLRLEERPVPVPAAGEVLVRVRSVGVCGSDVHYWHKGHIGSQVAEPPFVLGHECAGTVEALGPGVTALKPGDRVAMEPGVPCRECWYCRSGRYNLCRSMRFWADPPVDGALCRFVTHAVDFCYPLPDAVSLDEGALVEPLSVGIHACRLGRVAPGSRVLVSGVGSIGLVTVLAAKAAGAAKVVAVDVRDDRLKIAKSIGADEALRTEGSEAVGGPVDVAIECSGGPSAVTTAIDATRAGGVVVLVGQGPAEVGLPVVKLITRELEIRGLYRYVDTYPTAIGLLASGAIDVKRLITHRFPLAEVSRAFETAQASPEAVKVIVNLD